MINNRPAIAILMSTYNGEKYLRSQLDSIVTQSYKNWILYVRDDGSSDSSLSILNTYAAKYPKIQIVNDNTRRGCLNSFMWLLEHIHSEYYMFCDQDDVWLDNKIEMTLNAILKCDNNVPTVVCTDLIVVDESLNEISPSMWNYMKLRPRLLSKIKYLVSCNLFTGCTMLFNEKAKSVAFPVGKHAILHDAWVGLSVVANNGVVRCIEEPSILYRQHNNVCGAHKVDSSLAYYKSKILSIPIIYRRYKSQYKMVNDILSGYSIVRFILYRIIYLIRR